MADTAMLGHLRANLDDGGAGQAFLDAELAALLDRAGGDLLVAERDAWWQLHAGAVKEIDYAIGPDREHASQRAKQIGDRLDRVERRIAAQRGGLRTIAPQRTGAVPRDAFAG